MADDTAGLLDALDLPTAHICGASMGGMIAQRLAAQHPKRVKSLTLMMTCSGARRLPGPTLKVRSALISRPKNAANVQSVIEHYVKLYKLIRSPAYPSDDADLHERLGASVRRSYLLRGTARQVAAIAADGDRSPLLGAIKAPTQIVHGKDDPLVPVAAALDLAARIPKSQIDLICGMGHDLPAPLWARFVADIASAAARA
jgi:pimeloyl-ACP methyl ester carboxylesterase